MLGGCGSSSVPSVDSNTKKPCVPSEATLLMLPWTLGDGFCLDFTTFGLVMMATGRSRARVADGTPELPRDPALLSKDHSLQGSLEDLVLTGLSRAEKEAY